MCFIYMCSTRLMINPTTVVTRVSQSPFKLAKSRNKSSSNVSESISAPAASKFDNDIKEIKEKSIFFGTKLQDIQYNGRLSLTSWAAVLNPTGSLVDSLKKKE